VRIVPRSGQDRLEAPIPACVAETTGGVALHQVDLGFGGSRELQSGQFARQGGKALQHRFTPHSSLAPRAGLSKREAWIFFLQDQVGDHAWGMDFQKFNQPIRPHRVKRCHEPSVLPSLVFGLAFEFRIRHLHRGAQR